MTQQELDKVLELHKKWIKNEEGGARADLQRADLQRADLQRADLQGADLQGADLQGAYLREADLREANLREADLREANLREANLQRAYLRGADLQGADLDFSCFPLWCGGSQFTTDAKLVRQLLAHICTLTVPDADDELKAVLSAILPEAKKSHRAEDLGLLEEEEGGTKK